MAGQSLLHPRRCGLDGPRQEGSALRRDDGGSVVKRVLVPTSALMWGLQMAFLSPALALILVNLYGATTAEVGWVLSIYNASGFVASLVLPAYADRKGEYLGPM